MSFKFCKTCAKLLSKNNKTGFCIRHNKSGEMNPFYGKTHSQETLKAIKKKTSEASKRKWQDNNYRQRVITNQSKPRHQDFAKQQSDRVKDWYQKNPLQRALRSRRMKQTWKEGKIIPSPQSRNDSKLELQLFEDLKNIYNIEKKTVRTKDGRWVIPDVILIDIKHIVEFYGDYWHANPKIYKSDEIIHHKLKAKEIWESDKKRIERLEDLGYFVHIVWQSEYIDNRQEIVDWFNNYLNWETCSF